MNSNTKMRKSDRKLAKQNKPKFMQQVRTGWSNTQKTVNFHGSHETSSPLLHHLTAQKKGDQFSSGLGQILLCSSATKETEFQANTVLTELPDTWTT